MQPSSVQQAAMQASAVAVFWLILLQWSYHISKTNSKDTVYTSKHTFLFSVDGLSLIYACGHSQISSH